MAISYTKLVRGARPTATLDSQTPPPSQTTTPPPDGSPALLGCSQQSTFVGPQAAIRQPTNLQPQIKSDFKKDSLTGRSSGESFQLAFRPGLRGGPTQRGLVVVGHEVVVMGAAGPGLSGWVVLNHPSDRRKPRCHDPP